MPIDISYEDLEIVQSILTQHIPHEEVWAFGSRMTGKARKFSDLDLVIINDHPLDFNRYASLKEAFSESDLPFKVDIVDWASIHEEFKQNIRSNYVVLKKKVETIRKNYHIIW